MTLIDTHTHLFLEEFDADRKQVFERAADAGVKKMLFPNIDVSTVERLHQTCNSFPDRCLPMMGLHPSSVGADYKEALKQIKEILDKGGYVAVGETGIDLYWDKTFQKEQEEAFRAHINWAIEKRLPVVIHARESFKEIFAIIDDMNCHELRGVFHCFTGTSEDAEKIIAYGGFKMGIGGVLTFKNAGLDKVIENVSLDHLLLETDAPYLAPTPHRGKRNESSFVKLVASRLAEIKNTSLDEVAEITSANAATLFNLDNL